MEKYSPTKIEKKWQDVWEKGGIYKAEDFSPKTKFYCLVEFPYPSGAGLHVGHVRSWSAMDTYSRKKRMEGFNVLYPMGWDAFGLPAENYAIKMKLHPSQIVPENIARFKKQCQSLGLSFDWGREIDTTSPRYYKWTQWIFIQLFKRGLAYQDKVLVNWCPSCRTNLADEEIIEGAKHERCGNLTEKRPQKQWLLRITQYADRLLTDLKPLDFPWKIASQQINWIGRKEWLDIDYPIEATSQVLTVSTTRPETNFGASFIVVAPEHPFLGSVKNLIPPSQRSVVEEYLRQSQKKTELERISVGRQKTGVFTGLYALNRLNGVRLPIWTADFVLNEVGTGAIVGVPSHDRRDFEFAQQFDLPVRRVVVGPGDVGGPIDSRDEVWEGEGRLINSDFLNGLSTQEAWEKVAQFLSQKGWGRRATRYHLRDWVFSRQHYWGEPIPIIHCSKCGPVAVPESELPVELPYLKSYQPSETGESPLGQVEDWVRTTCPHCGGEGRRETDTMPNWAGSNWYFLRYLDPGNGQALADRERMDYWLPVDLYQGGFEHTTLHLLYSRFIYKFLFDIGAVPNSEPYLKRRSHGVVLGPDGRKMSKSFGNVINPDEVVAQYGADTLRLYELFIGPFDQTVAWSLSGLAGVYRFLGRVWDLFMRRKTEDESQETGDGSRVRRLLARLSTQVSSDIEAMKFNTAVSALMEFINEAQSLVLRPNDWRVFLRVLAPLAPHLSEELWQRLLLSDKWQLTSHNGEHFHSVHQESWPEVERADLVEASVVLVIQVNGKVRGRLEVAGEASQSQEAIEKKAREMPVVAKHLQGRSLERVVFLPGKILNFVVDDQDETT